MDRPPYRSRIVAPCISGSARERHRRSLFDLVKHSRNVEFSTEGGNGRIHCPLRLQRACNYLETKDQFGGERGIRSLGHPLDSVSYRNHIARNARNASVAVGPCSFLPPEGTANRSSSKVARRTGRFPQLHQFVTVGPSRRHTRHLRRRNLWISLPGGRFSRYKGNDRQMDSAGAARLTRRSRADRTRGCHAHRAADHRRYRRRRYRSAGSTCPGDPGVHALQRPASDRRRRLSARRPRRTGGAGPG